MEKQAANAKFEYVDRVILDLDDFQIDYKIRAECNDGKFRYFFVQTNDGQYRPDLGGQICDENSNLVQDDDLYEVVDAKSMIEFVNEIAENDYNASHQDEE